VNAPYSFYLPEDPGNTILDSALSSVRFAAAVCEDPGDGSLRCRSMDAVPDGSLVAFRGRMIDGVGYCTDTVFAANQIIRLGRLLNSARMLRFGERLAAHALAAGFFDDPALPVRMYLDTDTGEFLDNLEAHETYIEPGHMARVGHQLLMLSDLLDDAMSSRARAAAERIADWVPQLQRCDNGWFPRRSTPDGAVFPFAADAFGPVGLGAALPPDPIHDRSGSGTLIMQFLVEAHARGLGDFQSMISDTVDGFIRAGGHFGSTNSDTEDLEENVSYAMAFQTLHAAGTLFEQPDWLEFAYDCCLEPLARFELVEDLNGLATKGLLYMEDSWNSACTWEIAEAAQAYLVAYGDRGTRTDLLKALTMLRGLAKHHHGPHGFLTEAVDWDGHSVVTRHMDGQRYSDIVTTHPFLNNLHVLEPTITFLDRFAVRAAVRDEPSAFYDPEGNRLGAARLEEADWLPS
jgi:hypothetical protein